MLDLDFVSKTIDNFVFYCIDRQLYSVLTELYTQDYQPRQGHNSTVQAVH